MSNRAPAQENSTPLPLVIGEPFAPYQRFLGPTCPRAVFGLPIASDSIVLLLYYFDACREKSTTCEHFKETAKKLGWSEDRYGRAFAELRAHGYVSRKSNGPGKLSTITLLWHPSLAVSLNPRKPNNQEYFDSANTRTQDSAELRSQPKSLTPQIQPVDSAESGVQTPQKCGEIKERGFSFKGSFQVSSSKEPPVVEKPSVPGQANDDEPTLPIEPTQAEAEHAWDEDEVAFVRGTIARHRHAPYEPTEAALPDWEFTAMYLKLFRNLEDFKLYWFTRGRQLEKPKVSGHGLYLADVKRYWIPVRAKCRQEAAADPSESAIHHGNLKGVSATVAWLTMRPQAREASPAPPSPTTPQALHPTPEDTDRKRAWLAQKIDEKRATLAAYPGYINAYVWQAQIKHLEAQLDDLDGGHTAAFSRGEQAGGQVARPATDPDEQAPLIGPEKPAAVAAATPMHSHRQPAATARRRSGDHGFSQVGATLRAMAI